MLVLSHPYFNYRMSSSIKGKYISRIEYNNFNSKLNGKSLSRCKDGYTVESFINGKGCSQ